MFEEHNIGLIDWPARSPDLNIIENCWSMLKTNVERRQPGDISSLKMYIQEEWDNLTMDYIMSLHNSIPTRLNKCIEANGNVINY